MDTTDIVDFARRDGMTDALKTGARQLIASAGKAGLAGYMTQFADLRTEEGHAAAVVRNGHHPARPFQTGIGPVSVRIFRARSKDGTPVTFRSALVSPYVRRTKTLEAALPGPYLEGASSGETGAARKVSQPKARAAIDDIWQAETKDDADKAFDLFIKIYEPKYPKAVLCLQKDREELMAFFDYPAQHWHSIRTSNPIESAFATIRHRIRRSKGGLSRDGMLHIPLVTLLRNARPAPLPGSGCSSWGNALGKTGENHGSNLD